jgi:hypothetical protein
VLKVICSSERLILRTVCGTKRENSQWRSQHNMNCDSDVKITKVVGLRWSRLISGIDDGKPASILTVGKPEGGRD